MATTITDEAQTGYFADHPASLTGTANPYIYSSALWYGFEAGRAMGRAAYTKPIRATMGRGYKVNVWTAANRFLVSFDDKGTPAIYRHG